MIDVSHISEKSFWDVLALTGATVIASHSGCAALHPHARNLTDAQLKALAGNRGVIQIVALARYLKAERSARRRAVEELEQEVAFAWLSPREMRTLTGKELADYNAKRRTYLQRMAAVDAKYPVASLADFVNHIDHAVKAAGVDHVSIGTDSDGGGGIPGYNDESQALIRQWLAEGIRRELRLDSK